MCQELCTDPALNYETLPLPSCSEDRVILLVKYPQRSLVIALQPVGPLDLFLMWSLESLSKIQFSSFCLLLSQNILLRGGQGSQEMQIMALDLTLGQEHRKCGTAAQKAQLCHVLFVVCVHLVCQDKTYLIQPHNPVAGGDAPSSLHQFFFLFPHSSLVSQKNLWTGQVPPFGHQVWPWLGSGSPGESVCVGTSSR